MDAGCLAPSLTLTLHRYPSVVRDDSEPVFRLSHIPCEPYDEFPISNPTLNNPKISKIQHLTPQRWTCFRFFFRGFLCTSTRPNQYNRPNRQLSRHVLIKTVVKPEARFRSAPTINVSPYAPPRQMILSPYRFPFLTKVQ